MPFSLRKKVESKLHELEQLDIIEKVKQPTPWLSPIAVVPKPSGEIRLCIDMRRANEAIVRERHPIPTVDEVLQDMTQSSVFSKLDLKWGYHQLKLSEESCDITTFSTHAGLYCYKRLMFGITSAPEIYQHAIQQALHGCEGVCNTSDIILHAKDDQQHNERLKKLLERLQQRGLTLNGERCNFKMPPVRIHGIPTVFTWYCTHRIQSLSNSRRQRARVCRRNEKFYRTCEFQCKIHSKSGHSCGTTSTPDMKRCNIQMGREATRSIQSPEGNTSKC